MQPRNSVPEAAQPQAKQCHRERLALVVRVDAPEADERARVEAHRGVVMAKVLSHQVWREEVDARGDRGVRGERGRRRDWEAGLVERGARCVHEHADALDSEER